MFSRKVVKSAILASAVVLSCAAQPSLAATDTASQKAATQQTWVQYWLGYIAELDRKVWAHG